jgi:dipeptidyl aminopeptidase/acylaminoacyl peptidase
LGTPQGENGKVQVVDVATGTPLSSWKNSKVAAVAAAFTPDGKALLTAERKGVLRLWQPRTAQEIRRLGCSSDGVSKMALSADGTRLATVGSVCCESIQPSFASNNCMRFWDTASGKEIRQLILKAKKKREDDADLNGIGFSPDGKTVWTCEREGLLRAWNWHSGKETRCFADHPGKWGALAFAPDGQSLAVVQSEQIVRVRHPETGRDLIPQIEHRQKIVKVSISRDGRMAATASKDGAICLWELSTGRFLRRLAEDTVLGSSFDLSGERTIISFEDAISPDGRTLAWAALGDTALYLTEIASGRVRRSLDGHQNEIKSLVFSTNGHYLVSVSRDATALVWDLTQRPSAVARPLTQEDLDSCWTDLQHADAKRAYAAQLRLQNDPKRAVVDLERRLRPVVALEERRLAQRLADLENDQFAIREEAMSELALLVDVVEPALRCELTKRPSLEMRRRVEALLAQLDVAYSLPRLRQLRAVEVLEAMGTLQSLDACSRNWRRELPRLCKRARPRWLWRDERGEVRTAWEPEEDFIVVPPCRTYLTEE